MNITELYEIATPTCMISQYWPTSREKEGDTLAALQWVLEDQFFRAFQTVEVPYAAERKAIAELLAPDNLYLDYCVARVLNDQQGNLSSLDEEQRSRSVQIVIQQLADAREIGASSLSLVPGKRPAEWSLREKTLEALRQSMTEITSYATEHYPDIDILLEPLDVKAHKKHSFGYISDAQQLTAALQEQGLSLYINVDTAHCWLNEEDPVAMLQAVPKVLEFHFCNCVTDPDSELYGDHHMPLGEPGRMTHATMARMIAQLKETGFLNKQDKPYLLFEVIKPPTVDSQTHLRHCQQFFIDALAQV